MSRLMTTAELAERLHLNEETVRRLVREQRIPAIRICRVLRFDAEAVEAAIARASGTAPARDRGDLQPVRRQRDLRTVRGPAQANV
jgi:excisionase family DNA binding protein